MTLSWQPRNDASRVLPNVPYSIDCCEISASQCGEEVTRFGTSKRVAAPRSDVSDTMFTTRAALVDRRFHRTCTTLATTQIVRDSRELIRRRRVSAATPNYVTSLEMAGCSITVRFLDTELRSLRDAPVQMAALRGALEHPPS